MPGYNVFRKDRQLGKGGGVLLYVKSHLKCHKLKRPTEIQLELVLKLHFLQVCPSLLYVYIKDLQPKQISMISLKRFLICVTIKKT